LTIISMTITRSLSVYHTKTRFLKYLELSLFLRNLELLLKYRIIGMVNDSRLYFIIKCHEVTEFYWILILS